MILSNCLYRAVTEDLRSITVPMIDFVDDCAEVDVSAILVALEYLRCLQISALEKAADNS